MNRKLTTLACALVAASSLVAQTPVKNDFNGDGKSDMLWMRTGTSAVSQLQIFNSSVLANAIVQTPSSVNWVIAGTLDVSGDGKADLIWHNRVTGQVWLTMMNGLSPVDAGKSVITQNNPDWQILFADTFGAGLPTLVWRNATTLQVYQMVLKADGTVDATKGGFHAYTPGDANFKPVGKFANQLFWFNGVTGEVWVNALDAVTGMPVGDSTKILTASSAAWQVVGVGDFNRDGNADILWWNATTGEVWLSLLNASNAEITTDAGHGVSGVITNSKAGGSWSPVAIGDYNGDGYADVLWSQGGGVADRNIFQMFMDSVKPGKVNTKDSSIIYSLDHTVAAGELLNWLPVAGLSTTFIEAPVVTSEITNTTAFSYNLKAAANAQPPELYITKGGGVSGTVTVASSVSGPLASDAAKAITWSALKADGSATAASNVTLDTPVTGSGTESINVQSATAQSFILKGVSVVDPSKVTTRLVTAVDAPGVTTLAASPSSIALGGSSTLSYAFPANQTGILTDDAGSAPLTLSATGTTWSVTPAATTTYTLAVSNLAGMVSKSTSVVTVTSNNTSLPTTVTINGKVASGITYLTAGGIYAASVPATAGATYLWTITNASGTVFNSGTSTNAVNFTAGTANATPITLSCRVTLNGQYNDGSASATIVATPAKPAAPIVASDLPATAQADYLTALRTGQTVTASGAADDHYEWTVSNATITAPTAVSGIYSGNVLTITPAANGQITINQYNVNKAGTKSAVRTITRTITPSPDATVATATDYVTAGVTANASVGSMGTVPVGVTATPYVWSFGKGAPFTGSGDPTTDNTVANGSTNAISYQLSTTAGKFAPGDKLTVGCVVTNATGLTSTAIASPVAVKNVTVCGLPVTPSNFRLGTQLLTAPSADTYVTVGRDLIASVKEDGNPALAYDKRTYTWTLTNATIVSGQGTNTIHYQATAAGAVTFSISEANAANVVAATPLTPNTGGSAIAVTAVVAPQITTAPYWTASTISSGTSAVLNFAYTGADTATVSDAVATGSATVLASQAGLATTATKATFTTALANANGKWAADAETRHSVTLLVTNKAGDTATAVAPLLDIASTPVISGAGSGVFGVKDAAGNTAYTASTAAIDYGTKVQLNPYFSTGDTTTGYYGQTAAVTPGPLDVMSVSANPSTINYQVTPVQGQTIYTLTVTNRAGKSVAVSTFPVNVNPIAIAVPAVTSGYLAPGDACTYTSAVTGAISPYNAVTYSLTSNSNSAITINATTGALNLASAVAGDTFKVLATSTVDNTKTNITSPQTVNAAVTITVGACTKTSGSLSIATGSPAYTATANQGGVTYSIAYTGTGTATINAATGVVNISATTAGGTFTVTATSTADATKSSTSATQTITA